METSGIRICLVGSLAKLNLSPPLFVHCQEGETDTLKTRFICLNSKHKTTITSNTLIVKYYLLEYFHLTH